MAQVSETIWKRGQVLKKGGYVTETNKGTIGYYNDLAVKYNNQYYVNPIYPANQTRVNIILKRIKELKAKSVVECGCGTSFPLIKFLKLGLRGRGFDISKGMVKESKRNLIKAGYNPDLVCEADLVKKVPFKEKFDVMMMHGPLMHCSDERKLLKNAIKMLKKGGVLLCEVRNELMSAFSMNEHTRRFFLDLVEIDKIPSPIKEDVIKYYSKFKGTGRRRNQPWDANYITRFYNPFTIHRLFEECGFTVVNFHFAHYHCLPPIFMKKYPEFYYTQSLKIEKPDDWRGYLMASTFILEAKK